MEDKFQIKIPIISFFSGGGFLDIGFEQAGFEIVWTNENDEVFAKLHSEGISNWRKSNGNGIKAEIFNTKSILEITPNDILSEAFSSKIPKDFGIIGGPPCQDFSINGSLKGFKGERGKLTVTFLDNILELQPTFFVMENVTGLINSKSTKETLQNLLTGIKKKYFVDYKTLNALEFGVPQFRKRVFFIGIRKDKIDENVFENIESEKWFTFPFNTKYQNANKKFNWQSPTKFGKKLKKPKDLPLELCVESCLVPKSKLNLISNANEFFNLYIKKSVLDNINEGETNRPSFKRLHRFKYSPTACYGNNEVHLHPYEHRRLSVREALRIQGVPDTYVLPTDLPLSKKFKMIGNGVPVPLANALAISLKSFLINKNVI